MSEPDDLLSKARAEAAKTGVEPASSSAYGEAAGDVIDRYELCEEIGEGGMGSVWMAEQKEPVKRRVALKIIKLGMDTKEVVVRFEAERQALALMDHPHIAKVLDGGATESGRPYFVMELVRGTPITEYCDTAKAGLRERLELFTKVCAAVQHAHQKGIIHRDLKPGNVLVTLHDGVPVPKVIDFGIAKATSAELTQKTMFTQHAQILGTPEYMAPEQAEMSGLDIDTRADVYSLGVLLYELLTGTKPFDIRDVLEQGYQELLRTIREEDPAKPSTRVSTLGEGASPIATGRQVDVETLGKRLRGDLDWVVMKALEKDRTRRYETATGFAADIERYLREEPVTAAPPSARYRLRKFVRRRKKTVVAAGLITLLLVAGSAGTGIGWWSTQQANSKLGVALNEKNEALAEEQRQRELAEENEARALAAEQAATRRADELDQVASFQAAQLQQIHPQRMGSRLRASLIEAAAVDQRESLAAALEGLNFTSLSLQALRESLFDRTLEAIDSEFTALPLVQAKLLRVFGLTAQALGLNDLARDPLERALALRRHELPADHPDTLEATSTLALWLYSQGRPAEAEPYCREALEGRRRVLGDEHQDTLASRNSLGLVLAAQGRLAEAEAESRAALAGRQEHLGDDHLETIQSLNNVGSLLQEMGRPAEAEEHYRKAIAGARRTLGDHRATLMALNNLATLLTEARRFDEAELYCRDVLDGFRRLQGNEHPETLQAINSLGAILLAQGKLAEAEPCFREALAGLRSAFDQQHPNTQRALQGMVVVLDESVQFDRARGDREALGVHLAERGSIELFRGNAGAAEPLLIEALELLRDVQGEGDWRTLIAMAELGTTYVRQGRFDEAEFLLLDSADWLLEGGRVPEDTAWLGLDPVSSAVLGVIELYTTRHAIDSDAGHGSRAEEWRARLGRR